MNQGKFFDSVGNARVNLKLHLAVDGPKFLIEEVILLHEVLSIKTRLFNVESQNIAVDNVLLTPKNYCPLLLETVFSVPNVDTVRTTRPPRLLIIEFLGEGGSTVKDFL